MSTRKRTDGADGINTGSRSKATPKDNGQVSEITEIRIGSPSRKAAPPQNSQGNRRASERSRDNGSKTATLEKETQVVEVRLVDIIRRGFEADIFVDLTEAAQTVAVVLNNTNITIDEFNELVEHYRYEDNNAQMKAMKRRQQSAR